MKLMGVDRKICEFPDCEKNATEIIIHGWESGLNTHALCEEHFKLTTKEEKIRC